MNWRRARQRLFLVGWAAGITLVIFALNFACLTGLTLRTTRLIHYGLCGQPGGYGIYLEFTYVAGWLAMAMPVSIAAVLASLMWSAFGLRISN